MIQPAFSDPGRLVLAGFLAGYRGLTRDADAWTCAFVSRAPQAQIQGLKERMAGS